MAWADWIDLMGPQYVAYATETAQAEANYENAATIAAVQPVSTSATTPDDSVALAQAAQTYTQQDSQLQAAAVLALAQADKAHMVAQATASQTQALAQAQYQEDYETDLDPWDAADSGATGDPQDDTAADQAYAVTLAQADQTWSDAVLAAQQDLAVGKATASAKLAKQNASIDAQNAQATGQQYAADDQTLAQAQVSQWNAMTTAGNAWNTATTLAETGFVSAGYAAEVTAVNTLVADMPSTAPGYDWAQFRADLATARSAWWQDFAPTVLLNTAVANLSATAYQAQVDTSYLLASSAAAAADSAYISGQATAQDNQVAADAKADQADTIAVANATYDDSTALAADLEQYQVSQAQGDGLYTLANQQADDAKAGVDYAFRVAKAGAKDAIAVARDDYNATTSAAQSTASWTQAQDAATLAVTVAESQAYAAEQTNLSALTAATYHAMGDSYAAAMSAFATAPCTSTPWSHLEAANAAAAATYNDQALAAWLATQTSDLAAQSQAEISAAQADAVFSDQTAAATLAGQLSAAAETLAGIRAGQLAVLAGAQAAQQKGQGTAPAPPSRRP